jgi:protein-disulfide isomerase
MHDLLFQNQEQLKIDNLKQYAKEIGLNESSFLSCIDSKETDAKIREDLRAGASAGVDGTPALFVNGRSFYGNYPYQDLAEVIEEELIPDKSK